MAVLDKKARKLQLAGVHKKSHKVLSCGDMKILYYSSGLENNMPKGFQPRMIFNLALLTGVRPTELHSIEVDQFQEVDAKGGGNQLAHTNGSGTG